MRGRHVKVGFGFFLKIEPPKSYLTTLQMIREGKMVGGVVWTGLTM